MTSIYAKLVWYWPSHDIYVRKQVSSMDIFFVFGRSIQTEITVIEANKANIIFSHHIFITLIDPSSLPKRELTILSSSVHQCCCRSVGVILHHHLPGHLHHHLQYHLPRHPANIAQSIRIKGVYPQVSAYWAEQMSTKFIACTIPPQLLPYTPSPLSHERMDRRAQPAWWGRNNRKEGPMIAR